jgi:hypothetical protein
MKLVAMSLIVGAAGWLALAALMLRPMLKPQPGLEPVAYLAGAWAIAAPLVAATLRARQGFEPDRPSGPCQDRRGQTAQVAGLAVCESAVLLCGVALVVAPPHWPLYAALLPLGAMVALFPRD